MVKAGLIAGGVMLVLGLGAAAILSPLCTPCLALFIGLGAGYLAGQFDKPYVQNEAFKKGAVAGAIAGGLGLLGQFGAGLINASVMTPEMLNRLFGSNMVTKETLWLGQLGGAFCIGLFNVLLMAGLGVGGAAIWFSMNKDKQVSPPPASYPPQY